MSGSKRIARLNEQLKREISELIRRQVRDPRVGQVTITGVDVARDLGSAKVYIRGADTPEQMALRFVRDYSKQILARWECRSAMMQTGSIAGITLKRRVLK